MRYCPLLTPAAICAAACVSLQRMCWRALALMKSDGRLWLQHRRRATWRSTPCSTRFLPWLRTFGSLNTARLAQMMTLSSMPGSARLARCVCFLDSCRLLLMAHVQATLKPCAVKNDLNARGIVHMHPLPIDGFCWPSRDIDVSACIGIVHACGNVKCALYKSHIYQAIPGDEAICLQCVGIAWLCSAVLQTGDLACVCWVQVTPLHTDPKHNLLAQAVGHKYIRLYEPCATAQLRLFTEGLTTNASQVDLDDADDFQSVSHVPFQECILNDGQMLYIPPRWMHYVKSLSASFSVSFWWE